MFCLLVLELCLLALYNLCHSSIFWPSGFTFASRVGLTRAAVLQCQFTVVFLMEKVSSPVVSKDKAKCNTPLPTPWRMEVGREGDYIPIATLSPPE